MALRHPWFSQPLKRKCPDDLLSQADVGSGFGVGGIASGGLTAANAYNVAQTIQPNQTYNSSSNGRATKRLRKFESRNLERGFAELSIRPTSPATPPLTNFQPHWQHLGHQPGPQTGGNRNDVVVNVGENSSVVCPGGSTVPLLRSNSVTDEPPPSEVHDIHMSTSTWYEPEKDRIIITSLDEDDEYDGDDEGQQQQRTGTKPTTAPEPEFTISPAFLNMINKKLTQPLPPAPSTGVSESQALVLFRPLPFITPPTVDDGLNLKNGPSREEGMFDSSIPKPSYSASSAPLPFDVQDVELPLFTSGDDDMEIEIL